MSDELLEGQRRMMRGMAAATLLGMPVIGWVIARWSNEVNLWDRWVGFAPLWKQLLIGLPYGILAALFARFIISRHFMRGVRMRYERMFKGLRLNWSEVVFISMCAGVGEELLFRGCLQPLMGIILTAVIFVAIHGYLNPRDWRISVYGAYMTAITFGFGWMTEEFGVWSAVTAHMVIDVLLLADLTKDEPSNED